MSERVTGREHSGDLVPWTPALGDPGSGPLRFANSPAPRPPRTIEAVARLPRVRGYQRGVLEDGARFKVLVCGRRWGKTKVGVVAACGGHGPVVEMADSDGGGGAPYEWREKRWKGALQGARIGWVVPSDEHPSALDVWRDLKKAIGRVAIGVSGKATVGEE